MHKKTIKKQVKKYISKGKRLEKLGKFELAAEKYTKAIELNPNNAKAYNFRGGVNMVIEPDQAIKDFSKAIKLKPNYVSAYESRAILYEFSYDNKQQEAILDFTIIISYNQNHFNSFCHRSQIYSKLEQYNLSIRDYTKAIELKPKAFRLYILRGQDFCKLQQYDKAIEDFTVAITSDKWHEKADGYIALGKTYCLLKDYANAINCYTKAIKIFEGTKNPYLEKCYKKRSEVYLLLGEQEKADTDLKLADELEFKNQNNAVGIMF